MHELDPEITSSLDEVLRLGKQLAHRCEVASGLADHAARQHEIVLKIDWEHRAPVRIEHLFDGLADHLAEDLFHSGHLLQCAPILSAAGATSKASIPFQFSSASFEEPFQLAGGEIARESDPEALLDNSFRGQRRTVQLCYRPTAPEDDDPITQERQVLVF